MKRMPSSCGRNIALAVSFCVTACLFIFANPTISFAKPVPFARPLVVGSKGDDVTALQTILAQQGVLTAAPTGYYGPLTAKAVASFQATHGIEPLGGVGPKTRALLNSLAPSTSDSLSTLYATLVTLQAHIAALSASTTTPTTPSSCTPLTITHALVVGSKGDDVAALQKFLQTKGFYTYPSITGYFGTVTAKAVAAFQKANGISPPGGVGPLTRAKIASVSTSCSSRCFSLRCVRHCRQ
jgi:peptidoglycan hydrolase-like protein with peptidoglycan-binding domain